MARIAGVDIPDNKRGEISLAYIYGIGRRSAQAILTKVGVNWDKKAKEWNDEESNAIRAAIAEQFKIEGALKSEVQLSIKRLMDIGCYRGTGNSYFWRTTTIGSEPPPTSLSLTPGFNPVLLSPQPRQKLFQQVSFRGS